MLLVGCVHCRYCRLFAQDWFTGQNLTGLSKGGNQINKSRDMYLKALEELVELASLQVATGVIHSCHHSP